MFSSCCRADDENLLILQIVYDPLYLPEDLNPDLADLLKGLLCKGLMLNIAESLSHYFIIFESSGPYYQ